MSEPAFQQRLAERAAQCGVELAPALAARLERYFRLLQRWNRTINLAGMDLEPVATSAIDRLLVEPVVAARACPPGGVRRIIDIGSGGGSPGIPFALALGDPALTLVESRSRKAAFLREALRTVELAGVVEVDRWESIAARHDLEDTFDLLTVRAVRIQSREWSQLATFVRPAGWLFLFRRAETPLDGLPGALEWQASIPLVPSLGSSLALIRRADE